MKKRISLIFITLTFILASLVFIKADLTTSLVSYHTYDADATDDHASYDFTASGATHSTVAGTYKLGSGAYSFDGVSDYLDNTTNYKDWSANEWIAMQAWIYVNRTSATDQYIIHNANPSGWQVFNLHVDANLKFHYVDDGGINNNVFSCPWNGVITNYQHIVVKHQFSVGHTEVWLNGTNITSSCSWDEGSATDNPRSDAQHFYIGAKATDKEFQGYIDEIAIWNRSLTGSEIGELWNNGDGLAYPLSSSPPTITVSTYNMSSALFTSGSNNATSWRQDTNIGIITQDQTPTIRFDTNIAAYCRLNTADQNWTTMGTNRNCSTTGSTSHVCTLAAADQFTLGSGTNSLYVGCIDGSYSVENTTSTSGLLNVSLDLYKMEGYVLHQNGSGYENVSVIIMNQTDQSMYTNLTTNSTGQWNASVYSGNWTVYAYDLTNTSQNGNITSWVEVP